MENSKILIALNNEIKDVVEDEAEGEKEKGKKSDFSPEQEENGSIYSDEIPSGYNSGEQYDTISTGYMSGEAYELPDTRMEIREPALDVIEECIQPLSDCAAYGNTGLAQNSDDSIFVLPRPLHPGKGSQGNLADLARAGSLSRASSTSSSSDVTTRNQMAHFGAEGFDGTTRSPGNNLGASLKNKMRKKANNTLAIPMETSPLGAHPYDIDAGESSDCGPGAGAATGGYRAVPSDTDTSAFDSDVAAFVANGVDRDVGASKGEGQDTNLELMHASQRNTSKAARLAARKAKRIRKHDEAWFEDNDSKAWVWSRIICFWGAILSMTLAIVSAGIMIYLMPQHCDPEHEWFQGSVSVDIQPSGPTLTSFHNKEDFASRLAELYYSGIKTLHVKNLSAADLFPSQNLTNSNHWRKIINECHKANLSVIIQIPIRVIEGSIAETKTQVQHKDISLALQFNISTVIRDWATIGVDGIFLDGLEHYGISAWVSSTLRTWAETYDKYRTTDKKRLLMTSLKFAQNFDENGHWTEGKDALKHIDLLDATIELDSYNKEVYSDILLRDIEKIGSWKRDDADLETPWINWNIRYIDGGNQQDLLKAALALQMLLPGTINVKESHMVKASSLFGNLTRIRSSAVPIYMNGNYKRCECAKGIEKESNFVIKEPAKSIFQLERFYSRRNRYVIVANFGTTATSLAPVGKIYSVGELILDTSETLKVNESVLIRETSLNAGQAIILKLPK